MKKAEELTAARNHREAVSVLTQAKAHANAAQLKEIEEKIKAADTEMNRGSLFDLMEQEHSRNLRYSSNSHTPNSRYTHRHRYREIRNRNVRNSRYRRDHNRHTRSIRNSQEYGHRNNSRHSRKQDRRYSRTRNTYS